MLNKQLTLKQERFIHEYLIDLNAAQAAIRSRYNKKSAYSIGFENLKKHEISEAIQRAAAERLERTRIDADYVLVGAREMFARCMQREQVTDSEGNPTGEWKFDSAGAAKALKLLGDHVKVNAFKAIDENDAPIDQNWTVTIVHSSKEEYDRREKCIEHNP